MTNGLLIGRQKSRVGEVKSNVFKNDYPEGRINEYSKDVDEIVGNSVE